MSQKELIKIEEKSIIPLAPKGILSSIQQHLEHSLITYTNDIEHILFKRMESMCKTDLDIQSISFNIEIEGREFKLKCHNFFTYLLSEGIYIPSQEAWATRRFVTTSGEYIFDTLKLEGVYIPNPPETKSLTKLN